MYGLFEGCKLIRCSKCIMRKKCCKEAFEAYNNIRGYMRCSLMNTSSIILKTTGGLISLMSFFLLMTFVPVPKPVTYVNDTLAFIALSTFFIGFGLLLSALMEE